MRRTHTGPEEAERGVRVSWDQVIAFRLSRHHLTERAPKAKLTSVLSDIAGAQAQVLTAAQMSLWPRVEGLRVEDTESAMWEQRSMVRASCMRRTMYLIPASEVSVYVRGTARRAGYEERYVLHRGVPPAELDRLLGAALDCLREPLSHTALAERVSKEAGLLLKTRRGGGWGSEGEVACVEVGGLTLSAGYMLHVAGARGVVCSGPKLGNESTSVRADKWVRHWKDMPVERAEEELVTRYLRAFGPSTVSDFAWWVGMYAGDAKEIWSKVAHDLVQVDVEGWKASVLRSDLDELLTASPEGHVTRLLPYFDSFLLGHRTKRHLVDDRHRASVYRGQGWVAPVLLVDGKAEGVWSHAKNSRGLTVEVKAFRGLPSRVSSAAKEEARRLGEFLGSPSTATTIEVGGDLRA